MTDPLAPVAETGLVRTLSVTYYDGHHVPPHRHDWGQLVHARSGIMRVIASSRIWVVPPTRAIWIPPGIEHEFATKGHVAFRTVYFPATRCGPDLRDLGAIEVSPLLRELILHVCAIAMLDLDCIGHNRLAGVLTDLIAAAPSIDLALPLPADPRALRLAEHFQAQPGDRANLPSLAARAGASVRTLQRCFSHETGMTIEAWRQKARLVASAAALSGGGSVTTAAFDSGYDSPSAFIAAFKRQFDMTPRQFARARDGI